MHLANHKLTQTARIGYSEHMNIVFFLTLDLETSRPWTQILDPDPEKPGLRKTLTLKNLDHENPGL